MRFVLAVAAVVAASSSFGATSAEAQRRAFPISMFELNCRRSALETFNTCERVASHARSRHGDEVTVYQWNAAVGVIRNQRRQGK